VSTKARVKDQRVVVVTGGARSGKSRFAKELAKQSGGEVVFVATASAQDEEMIRRIERHRRSRPRQWKMVEEEVDLVGVIDVLGEESKTVIIDCITLWLSNLIERGHRDKEILQETKRLSRALLQSPHTVILVTNDVGSGIVPENALARRFRDLAGEVNQILASSSQEVYLMVAGIPVKIKPNKPKVGGYL